MAFWERLHEILNREVVAERDRFFMAMLKRVGIEKGQAVQPNSEAEEAPRRSGVRRRSDGQGERSGEALDRALLEGCELEDRTWP